MTKYDRYYNISGDGKPVFVDPSKYKKKTYENLFPSRPDNMFTYEDIEFEELLHKISTQDCEFSTIGIIEDLQTVYSVMSKLKYLRRLYDIQYNISL